MVDEEGGAVMRRSSARKTAGGPGKGGRCGPRREPRGADLPLRDRATSQTPPVILNQGEIGDYACEILSSLRALTCEARLDFLTYLLDMAYEEAANTSNLMARRPDEEEK